MSTKSAWTRDQGRRIERFPAQEPETEKNTEQGQTDHLMALQDLLEQVFPNATQFFSHGLGLLVQRLDAFDQHVGRDHVSAFPRKAVSTNPV